MAQSNRLADIRRMQAYLWGWKAQSQYELDIQQRHRQAVAGLYLQMNPHNYRRPVLSWKARGIAFKLFDAGQRPRDISPRKTLFIKRKCLHVYFCEWLCIRKAEEAIYWLLVELCQQEQERRSREWAASPKVQVGTKRVRMW